MKRRLKDRFNEHRRPVDRPTPSSGPTAVPDHFLSDNHSPNDIELIPLELVHSSRDALRKAREAYLIERGQTLEEIFKLMFNPLIPHVLYYTLLSCHSLVYFNGLFFIDFYFCY